MKSCLKNPICFSFLEIIGANFSEARVRRNSSPQPPPSAATQRSGHEVFSEYPTIQNFSTFSLGTSPNASRAQWRGSQGIEPKNPTAQKTKRKRICISKILI